MCSSRPAVREELPVRRRHALDGEPLSFRQLGEENTQGGHDHLAAAAAEPGHDLDDPADRRRRGQERLGSFRIVLPEHAEPVGRPGAVAGSEGAAQQEGVRSPGSDRVRVVEVPGEERASAVGLTQRNEPGQRRRRLAVAHLPRRVPDVVGGVVRQAVRRGFPVPGLEDVAVCPDGRSQVLEPARHGNSWWSSVEVGRALTARRGSGARVAARA